MAIVNEHLLIVIWHPIRHCIIEVSGVETGKISLCIAIANLAADCIVIPCASLYLGIGLVNFRSIPAKESPPFRLVGTTGFASAVLADENLPWGRRVGLTACNIRSCTRPTGCASVDVAGCLAALIDRVVFAKLCITATDFLIAGRLDIKSTEITLGFRWRRLVER